MNNTELIRNKHNLKNDVNNLQTTKPTNNDTNFLNNIKNDINKLDVSLKNKQEENNKLSLEKKNFENKKQEHTENIQVLIESITKIKMVSDKIKTQVKENDKLDNELSSLKTEVEKLENKYSSKLDEINNSLEDINFFLSDHL